MLPAVHRLRDSSAFSDTTRQGSRARRDCVVSYAVASRHDQPARLGLIVSKAVGNSVVRHRVSRRLRGALAAVLPGVPAGVDIVVRALPLATTCPDFAHHAQEAVAKAVARARDGAGDVHD